MDTYVMHYSAYLTDFDNPGREHKMSGFVLQDGSHYNLKIGSVGMCPV
jgi:hypothetical protein